MKTFGQEVKNKPSFSTDKINKLRIDLIKEELEELTEAMKNKDLLEVADALTDILYVTYGAITLQQNECSNSSQLRKSFNEKHIYLTTQRTANIPCQEYYSQAAALKANSTLRAIYSTRQSSTSYLTFKTFRNHKFTL